VTIQDVVVQYEGRILELQSAIAQLRWPHALAAAVLAVALGLFLLLSLYAFRGQLSFLWASLPILTAAASARRLRKLRQSQSRLWRLKRFYDRALQRVKGDWACSGVTGEEFAPPDHVYAADLGVFGEGSLFELLCMARTSMGRRGLANYLLNAPAVDETLLRQDAVRELRGRTDLREKVATLGEFEFLESQQATFDDWLNSPRLSFPSALPAIAAVTSALLAGILAGGLLGIIPWTSVVIWIFPLVVFHSATGLLFRTRVNQMADWLRPVAIETRLLREGLQFLETEQFQSAKLRQISGRVRNGSRSIRKLERLLQALELRNKDVWFYGPSLALLAGTQLCIAVEQWRRKRGESLRTWLAAWAEFEALNALAAYGFENPDHTFPELADGPACFKARDLGHPLLPQGSCVANDIELDRESPFYIVSGSNMSGKSTLLRAVGLNAVLAFAGAPVRARALRLSGLSIFASISIVDSLLNGKSKFLAEVDRLRQAIESAVPNRPVLFLVDEIFSGTNSRDRRIAAEAVVRTLLNQGAIGALSTHDLALTEIAGAVNVHMGSKTEGDPMDFDYRLKPGVTTETNALAIARLAGVPV
jgi:MutS domain V